MAVQAEAHDFHARKVGIDFLQQKWTQASHKGDRIIQDDKLCQAARKSRRGNLHKCAGHGVGNRQWNLEGRAEFFSKLGQPFVGGAGIVVDGEQATSSGWGKGIVFDLDFDRMGIALHGQGHGCAFV